MSKKVFFYLQEQQNIFAQNFRMLYSGSDKILVMAKDTLALLLKIHKFQRFFRQSKNICHELIPVH